MSTPQAPNLPSPAYESYTELIAQELRTPIATIALYLDLMSRDRVLDDPLARRDYLEIARGQAHQLSQLVQELTQFTDLASGRALRGSEALTAVESLPTLVESIAGRNPVVLDIAEDATTATVDTDRLRMVLQQLLDNAFKFRTAGEPVVVRGRVTHDPPRLVVQVINDGQAVPPELRERIFHAFQQGRLDPDPSTREHGGLGLGLTVARGAAEGSGGSLVLEEGEPTTFRLEMPLREDPLARETRSLREQVEMLDKQAEAVVLDLRAALAEGRKKDQALEEAEKQQIEVLRDLQGLHRETRMLSQQLNQSYLNTVAALARAVQARDGQAADHIEGVRRTCMTIADQLGIHDDDRLQLEFAAVLHDVGKIALPDDVLTTDRELSDSEWEQMRKHPEMGAQLIEGIDFLGPAREAVLTHHERWDGSGYPRGLAGESIPRAARIIAVADAYETMINGRRYRAKLSPLEAAQELTQGSGTQFDPTVVAAFLAAIQP